MKSTLFAMIIGVISLTSSVFAEGEVTRLSEEGMGGIRPEISGDLVAWESYDEGSKRSFLQLYNVGTKQLMTVRDDNFTRKFPSLSGNLLVYKGIELKKFKEMVKDKKGKIIQEIVNVKEGDQALLLSEYDSFSGQYFETTISGGLEKSGRPAIDGRRIVWVEKDHKKDFKKMMLCEYKDGVCVNGKEVLIPKLKHMTQPALSGDLVVWRDGEKGVKHSKIKLMDLKNRETTLTVSENPSLVYGHPKISGNLVAWVFHAKDNDHYGIKYCLFDVTTKTCEEKMVPLMDALPGKNKKLEFDVSGQRIVWHQTYLNDQGKKETDIYSFNLEAQQIKMLGPWKSRQSHPSISGSKIVFQDRQFDPKVSAISFVVDETIEGVVYYGDPNNNKFGDCPGPIEISVNKTPRAGDTAFKILASGAPPNASATLIIGQPDFTGKIYFDATFYIDLNSPVVSYVTVTNDGGFVEVPLSLENYNEGDKVYAQYMFHNTESCGGESAIFSTSNAADITVQP